mmetsp:Transcript_4728/g.10088  ORF Transcript_4728/g.10088 Transcript_4728/m.10088 type:complete len:268 (+) Transcript_4728:49-852(+)
MRALPAVVLYILGRPHHQAPPPHLAATHTMHAATCDAATLQPAGGTVGPSPRSQTAACLTRGAARWWPPRPTACCLLDGHDLAHASRHGLRHVVDGHDTVHEVAPLCDAVFVHVVHLLLAPLHRRRGAGPAQAHVHLRPPHGALHAAVLAIVHALLLEADVGAVVWVWEVLRAGCERPVALATRVPLALRPAALLDVARLATGLGHVVAALEEVAGHGGVAEGDAVVPRRPCGGLDGGRQAAGLLCGWLPVVLAGLERTAGTLVHLD